MKRFWMLLVVVVALCLSACAYDVPTEQDTKGTHENSKPITTEPTSTGKTEQTEPGQVTEPTQPVATTQPTEPGAQPTEPETKPTEPTEPTEPTQPDFGVTPSENQLRQDLQNRLNAYVGGQFAQQTILEHSVLLTLTEPRGYMAVMNVVAQSVYADFTWSVEVYYTKFDQGWYMTDCRWGEYTWQQVRYPDAATMQTMLGEQKLQNTQQKELVQANGQIQYLYDYSADWSEYASGSVTCVALWEYDVFSDQWKYKDTQKDSTVIITNALEEVWMFDQSYETITIKNVTATGFDADISNFGISQHFVLTDAQISQENGDLLVLTFTSNDDWLGTTLITIYLPKNTTVVYGQTCDFGIKVLNRNVSAVQYVVGQESKAEYVDYSVQVSTAGGMAMENMGVSIFGGRNVLCEAAVTASDGTCTFRLIRGREYTIVLNDVPKGYAVQDSYPFTGERAEIQLTSSVITGENVAANTFRLGDVMYDFSFTDSEGNVVTLSEVLAEKDMVVLNFWYVDSYYCLPQLATMQSAYEYFSGDIEIFGINSYVSDDIYDIQAAKYDMGLTFPLGKAPSGFGIESFIDPVSGSIGAGYPTSVVIDRYGMICLINVGSIPSEYTWSSIFAHFTGDDYVQKLVHDPRDLVTGKPTVENPAVKDIANAFNGEKNLQVIYRWEEEENNAWPFLVGEKEGERCIYASNIKCDETYAILYADVTMKKSEVLAFDYWASCEQSDYLYVIVNGEAIYQISGQGNGWQSAYCWVAEADGVYELALCYMKDTSISGGDDTVYLKNLRTVSSADIDTPSYIPRQAATKQADGSYKYVNIYLNPNDGYYHVGSVDGPLLLAGLYTYTQFCQTATIYDWVMAGEINGEVGRDALMDYISAAVNSSLYGWCTVTEELAGYLKMVADIKGLLDDENEWLLLCKYYEAYGTGGKQMKDPVAGLRKWSAQTAVEGVGVETNHFYYDGRPLLPRGKLARFTPTKSGVYRITSSTNYTDQLDGWIWVDEFRDPIYTYERDELMRAEYCDDNNVTMVIYMEAGKNYYIDIALYDIYAIGDVWFDIEYIGESYQLLRFCSYGPFGLGDDMMTITCDAIDVAVNPATGYYHEVLERDAQGKPVRLGSVVYAYFGGPIYTFSSSIVRMIELGMFDFRKSEEDQEVLWYLEYNDYDQKATLQWLRQQWGDDFDIYYEYYQVADVFAGIYHGTGTDCTAQMQAYVDQMIQDPQHPELNGCVAVDQQLMEILQMLMDAYTFAGVENSWQKLCVYYDMLG